MKNILVILCLLLTCSAVVANDIDYDEIMKCIEEIVKVTVPVAV